MGDHVAVDVGELVASRAGEAAGLVPGGKEEAEALIGMVECRICQEEDLAKNLESPCTCSGSLKYAHRECVQRWCNEKGDITCEICHQVVILAAKKNASMGIRLSDCLEKCEDRNTYDGS